ncbi:hypothetical protein [Streptomyces sp. NPDC053048]|uniref:hypothetical protein n=1 Tax=Streptomyces sp. NPDC053048 TaxID=3365694 RepID=UPI0037D3EBA1
MDRSERRDLERAIAEGIKRSRRGNRREMKEAVAEGIRLYELERERERRAAMPAPPRTPSVRRKDDPRDRKTVIERIGDVAQVLWVAAVVLWYLLLASPFIAVVGFLVYWLVF